MSVGPTIFLSNNLVSSSVDTGGIMGLNYYKSFI